MLNKKGGLIATVGQCLSEHFFKPWTWGRRVPGGARYPTPGDTIGALESEARDICYVVDIFDGVMTLFKTQQGSKSIGD